jgi:glutaredoxin
MKLYTHKGCANCKKVKAVLLKLLPEMGLNYESSVVERDIDNTDVLADLMILDIEYTPTINIGNATITGDEILDEANLRRFVESNIKTSP